MNAKISILAVLLAVTALCVAVFVRPGEPIAPSAPDAKLAALEQQVASLRREVEGLHDRLAEPPARPGTPRAAPTETAGTDTGALTGAEPASAATEKLEEIVNAAVEKKTREVVSELAAKEDKKPSMDVFSSTLGLTEDQRRTVEQEVIRAQGEIRALLETPTADGRNFLDELVDLYAKSMVEPEKDPGWGMWYISLTAVKVPGTDETYAQRAGAAKKTLNESFRRTLNEEQYARYQAWKLDPTEIEEIEGSPFDDIGERIRDRARQLGADLPEEE